MFSKLKTLLIAGAALPLATGFAFAQSVQPTTAPVAPSSSVTATAPALAPSTTASVAAKSDIGKKDLGALKATPAEKKAMHDQTSATKTAALAPKHHSVKKHATVKTDATVSGKTTAPAANAEPKAVEPAPAKKL